MRNTRSPLAFAMATALLLGLSATAQAQTSGRFELEYDGPVMGGVTGVGATRSLSAGQFVIELPAVVRSYPTVRIARSGGLPDQPFQAAVGSGAGEFTVRFSHPDLPETYVGVGGAVRITEITDRVIRGDFAVVASPAGSLGARTLTIRGRFEAPAR
jgi:hypothetical protein